MAPEKINKNIDSLIFLNKKFPRALGRRHGNLDMRTASLAKFAESAYEANSHQRRKAIGTDNRDYAYDTKLSDLNASIFVNKHTKEVITSYKGTNIKNLEDLSADISIVIGQEELSERFKHAHEKQQAVFKKYNPKRYKHIVTGHSLGGSISNSLGRQYTDQITEIHAFNPGVGLAEVLNQKKNPNYHSHHIKGDLISILGTLDHSDTTHVYEKLTGTDNAHTIKQFQ